MTTKKMRKIGIGWILRYMKHKLKPKRKIEKLVLALDDWYPSINGYVRVTYTPANGWLRVWGDDDFGMEMLNASRQQFDKLCSVPITKDRCKKLGLSLS